MKRFAGSIFSVMLALSPWRSFADGCLQRNPPGSTDGEAKSSCGCPASGEDAAEVFDGCIKVHLGMGATTPWTGSESLALKVFADDSSPMVFTPDSLYPIMGYAFKRLGNAVLSDGVTAAEAVFSHPNGEPVHFVFKEGESLGRPDPGVHVPMDERLQMVDAQGWATAHDPVYWDLYETDGTVRRFLASDLTGRRGSLVSVTDSRGLVTTPDDMGVDLVYGPDGVRQFLTPSRLADVRVVDGGYDVAIYPLQATPTKDPATGLYPVPDVPTHRFLSVRSANGGKRAIVTLRTGSADPRRYVFDYASGDWSLTRPSGVREIKDRATVDSSKARLSKEVRSPDDTLLSKTVMNYTWESWGYAMTNKVEGFGGVTQTTSWTYYTSGNGTGKVRTSLSPSGLKTEYAYDAEGRKQTIRRSGPGMMTEATTYSYASVDPSDVVPPVDTRPRTIVKTLDGVECERTYCVYSPLTNIVERVGTQGAPYGGTNALRTITVFYPVMVGSSVPLDRRAGRIKSIRHENGRLDLYDYDLATNVWTETVTHFHEQSPAPVSGKTTRDITVTNRRGEIVERRTEAFVDGSWYNVFRTMNEFNLQGKVARSTDLAGRVTTTTWDCCHKISETQLDGSTTTWDYDDEGRMVAVSRLIPLDMSNVTWVTTSYAYDDLGHQTATWTTNYTAKIGTPAMTTSYDALGRVIARIDVLGNATTTSYSPDGRTVSVREPNGATTITSRNPDGDTLSIIGTGVTPEFHTRGVLADGTRWTRTVQGETASSPRFNKRYENLLGQTTREERSGFQGAVLATINTYDAYGRLVSTTSDGEPTSEYTYDSFGNRIAATRTVGADHRAARKWRKSESSSAYALGDGNVWLVQTNVNSCSDASIAPLVTSRSVQLTGLTAANPARTRTTDVRGNVTETWTEFANGFTLAKRRVPEATNVASSKSRYGVALETVSVSSVTNRTEYDALGHTVAQIDGRGNRTRTEYDAYGRRAASVDAAGNRTEYGYDALGRLIAVTNAMGDAVVYEYNLRGRKAYEGGATYPVRYAYDLFGNKVSMTTYRDEAAGVGDTTTWLYDAASGALTNKVYADGMGPAYTYDANGHLTRRTWARGVTSTYGYDGWGNLTNTIYSDGTPSVSLAFDAMGRQVAARDAAGVTTFAYDAYGANTNETVVGVAGTNMIERFTDAYGRDAGYALNGTRQTTLAYDPATGRLASMQTAGSETPFIWSYLAGTDLKSSLTYPNGLTASWTYDNRNQLLEVRNALSTNVISQYDYTYDAAGRRIGCGKSGSAFATDDTLAYLYNTRSELTNATATADADYRYGYAFDDIGNRRSSLERRVQSAEYESNSLNQYTAVDDFTPVYDDDGNQTLVKTSTGIWQITYNGENRPVRWENGDSVITMSYDRMGRRVTKNDQRFVYNGYLQIADNVGNVYVWDPTEPVATRPLAWNLSTSQLLFYTHDGNKNVSEVIASNNDIAAHYEYAPFGALSVLQGDDANVNPWLFSSEHYDIEIDAFYYAYRHYLHSYGRWMSPDPIEDLVHQGAYLFGRNRTFSVVDALGLSCYSTVWGGLYCYPDPTPAEIFAGIPDCPCSISLDHEGNPKESPSGWTTAEPTRHKGGTWEIRDDKSFWHITAGQQCVYDVCGKLINEGSGAGTPDYVSPTVCGYVFHVFYDVAPYYVSLWVLRCNEQEAEDRDHALHPPNLGRDESGRPCPRNDGSSVTRFEDCPCGKGM